MTAHAWKIYDIYVIMTFSPSLPVAPGGPCMNDKTHGWEGLSRPFKTTDEKRLEPL